MKNLDLKTYRFSLDELSITAQEVRDTAKMDLSIYDDYINYEMSLLKDIQSICGGTAIIKNVEIRKDGYAILNGEAFHVGRQISHDMKGSTEAVLFLCTAGDEISKRSQALMKDGKLLEGYFVDVLGSIMAEKAINKIHDGLISNYGTINLHCTNRYSPGYCDWEVVEQPKLFSFFPDRFCGISLSISCLMHPIKSISGIIGVGKDVQYHQYRCDICKSKNCVYRQVLDENSVGA